MLSSIVGSLRFVHELAYKSETALMESYLEQMWRERLDMLGALPDSGSAIAVMRLVIQVMLSIAGVG